MNDPFIEAIAERIRALAGRQPRYTVEVLAGVLDIPIEALRHLTEPQHLIDPIALIDVVAALVREFAVDPQWLLTGEYNGAVHRHALMLGEDRTPTAMRAIREFVRQQYVRLHDAASFVSMPPPIDSVE